MENQLVFVVVVSTEKELEESVRKSVEHWRKNTAAAYAAQIRVTEVGVTK